jgi:hypothetical protein
VCDKIQADFTAGKYKNFKRMKTTNAGTEKFDKAAATDN